MKTNMPDQEVNGKQGFFAKPFYHKEQQDGVQRIVPFPPFPDKCPFLAWGPPDLIGT
ncbi:hypothetical protein [Parapedobacter sp. 2B3]|uniref:hypothetical protein n=1 Tax=Parapedobacter sp. 2B3 TaxID=3342381 RepID=UPI0035B65F1D